MPEKWFDFQQTVALTALMAFVGLIFVMVFWPPAFTDAQQNLALILFTALVSVVTTIVNYLFNAESRRQREERMEKLAAITPSVCVDEEARSKIAAIETRISED